MIRRGFIRWLSLLALLTIVAACARQIVPRPADAAATDSNVPVPTPVASTSVSSTSRSTNPHVTAMPSAPRSNVILHLVAERVRWDEETLRAPAGVSFKLELDNRDGAPEFHNFVIADGPAVEDRIYASPKRQGPIIEMYVIPGLPAGTYTFVCTIHPDVMRGELTVR